MEERGLILEVSTRHFKLARKLSQRLARGTDRSGGMSARFEHSSLGSANATAKLESTEHLLGTFQLFNLLFIIRGPISFIALIILHPLF